MRLNTIFQIVLLLSPEEFGLRDKHTHKKNVIPGRQGRETSWTQPASIGHKINMYFTLKLPPEHFHLKVKGGR